MWPIVIIAGLAWALLQQGTNLMQQISYSISAVRFSFAGARLTINVTYDIQNRSNQGLLINSIDGVLLHNGREIGTFLKPDPVTIAPLGDTRLTIPVRINALETAQALYNAWRDKKVPTIQVRGGMSTNVARLPINETYGISA
jgi:hypothetical protein